MIRLLALLAWACWAALLPAEVVATNPGLADKETLNYLETTGNVAIPVVMTVTKVGRGASLRYEYRYKSPPLEALYRLSPDTLLSLSSEQIARNQDSTVKRTGDYRDLKLNPGPEDLEVTDLGSLAVQLRGFPFATTKFARVQFIGQLGAATLVSLELHVEGRDTIVAAGRSWDCWHVTTGLGGALSWFLPRTDWWFAVEGTHPLIKSTAPTVGFGSPTKTLLLQP